MLKKHELIEEINELLDSMSPEECRCFRKLTVSELVKVKHAIEDALSQASTDFTSPG